MSSCRIKAFVVPLCDDYTVIVRNDKRTKRNIWEFAGGTIRHGTPILRAVTTKIKFETGITIAPSALRLVAVTRFRDGCPLYLFVAYCGSKEDVFRQAMAEQESPCHRIIFTKVRELDRMNLRFDHASALRQADMNRLTRRCIS
jgi:ADP-ribose pyrophosphatase YjhB (NUDIX family)